MGYKLMVLKCYKGQEEIILFNKVVERLDEIDLIYEELKNLPLNKSKWYDKLLCNAAYIPKTNILYKSEDDLITVNNLRISSVIIRPVSEESNFFEVLNNWLIDYCKNTFTIIT